MSYILDALRKAEQQRDLGQVPGLATEHEPPRRARQWPWPWILAALLTVNILLLAWFLVVVRDADAPVAPAPSTQTEPRPAPVDAAATRPADVPLAPREDEAADRHAGSTAEPPAPAGMPPVAPPQPQPRTASTPAEPAASAAPVVSQGDTRPLIPLPLPPAPAVQPAGQAPATAAMPTVGQRPEPVAAPAQTPARPQQPVLPVYPLIDDALYARIQGRLVLNMHVYSANPDGRFVLLNMKKYNEGDRLFEGPTLERITEEGVVLSMDGQRFRIRAP